MSESWVVLEAHNEDAMFNLTFTIKGPFPNYYAAKEYANILCGEDCGETTNHYAWIKCVRPV